MSGFEVSRFPDLRQSQENQFICNICCDVLCKPVKTRCDHHFCEQCINHWIQDNKYCPKNDCKQRLILKRKRNTGTIEDNLFTKPDKKFIKLYKHLRIECNFVEKGCHQVLSLRSLSSHLEECDYHLCIDCGLKVGKKEDHNCIQLLKQVLDEQNVEKHVEKHNLKIKVRQLRQELIDRKKSSTNLKKKYRKTKSIAKNELRKSLNEKQLWKNRYNGLCFKYKKLLAEIVINKTVVKQNEVKNRDLMIEISKLNDLFNESKNDLNAIVDKNKLLSNENLQLFNYNKKLLADIQSQKSIVKENEEKYKKSLIECKNDNKVLFENQRIIEEKNNGNESLIKTQELFAEETEEKSKKLKIEFENKNQCLKINNDLLVETHQSIIKDNKEKLETPINQNIKFNEEVFEKKTFKTKSDEIQKQNHLLNIKIESQKLVIEENGEKVDQLLIKNQELEKKIVEKQTFEKNLRKENHLLIVENGRQKSIIKEKSKKIETNGRQLDSYLLERRKNRENIYELHKQNKSLKAKIESQKLIIEGNDELEKVLVFQFNLTLKQYNSLKFPIIRKDYIRVLYVNSSEIGLKYFGENGSGYSVDKEMPINCYELKRVHSAMTGIPNHRFRFFFNNRIIKDSSDPKYLGLRNGSIIDVLFVINLHNIEIINQKY